MSRFRALCFLAAVLPAVPAVSIAQEPAVPSPAVERFDRFIDTASPLCRTAPSTECFAKAWAFADEDGDEHLSNTETRNLRDAVAAWVQWPGNRADDAERARILLGLTLLEAAGLAPLTASLDTDRDGLLSKEEVLADVRLDERPMEEVLKDPQAVDRQSIANRLGALGPMVSSLFRQVGG